MCFLSATFFISFKLASLFCLNFIPICRFVCLWDLKIYVHIAEQINILWMLLLSYLRYIYVLAFMLLCDVQKVLESENTQFYKLSNKKELCSDYALWYVTLALGFCYKIVGVWIGFYGNVVLVGCQRRIWMRFCCRVIMKTIKSWTIHLNT